VVGGGVGVGVVGVVVGEGGGFNAWGTGSKMAATRSGTSGGGRGGGWGGGRGGRGGEVNVTWWRETRNVTTRPERRIPMVN
jgi:hypothetical protein